MVDQSLQGPLAGSRPMGFADRRQGSMFLSGHGVILWRYACHSYMVYMWRQLLSNEEAAGGVSGELSRVRRSQMFSKTWLLRVAFLERCTNGRLPMREDHQPAESREGGILPGGDSLLKSFRICCQGGDQLPQFRSLILLMIFVC